MTSRPAVEDETVLVCHAGPGVGLGHLSRLRALAKAMVADGSPPPRVVVIGEAAGARMPEGVRLTEVAAHEAGAALGALLSHQAPGVLVCDFSASHLDEALHRLLLAARSNGVKLVGIDGLRHWCELLDLLWIPSFHVDAATRTVCGEKTEFGWHCYLVEARGTVRAWRPGNRILVAIGGSDTTGLGAWLPSRLDRELSSTAQIHWVRGPFAGPPTIPDSPRCDWRVHSAPERMDELIAQADFALSAFGVSTIELLKYGIPTVVFSPYGSKDDEELGALAEQGVCEVADGAEAAVSRLRALIGDPDGASRLAAAAAARLSGDGPALLARRVRELAGA